MIYSSVFESPVGEVRIVEEGGFLIRVCLDAPDGGDFKACSESLLTKKAVKQLSEYFFGKRKRFELPIAFKNATPFRQKVWHALLQIPYGEMRTYGDIASEIGDPKAARAVGSAVHDNPLLIIVPCHRVIGANGRLTGFAAGLDAKRFLLELESENKPERNMDFMTAI